MENAPQRNEKGHFVKGAPSPNPKGKAYGREILNKEITEALRHALETAHPDGAKGYMLDLAQTKPALFVGMLQKAMPSENNLSVVAVSLGDAMQEANDRLRAYEARMIDITPGDPLKSTIEHIQPAADSIQPAAESQRKRRSVKVKDERC